MPKPEMSDQSEELTRGMPKPEMSEQSEELTPEAKLLRAIFGEVGEPSQQETTLTAPVARIAMASEPTVGEVIEFLQNVRKSYGAINSFLTSTIPTTYEPSHKLAQSWFREELYPSQDIVLARASLMSPGFWEFFGNLNPLKIICDYLQQRHERLKDRLYRNKAEEETLALKNAILRNQAVRERVDLLRKVGVPNEEIQLVLMNYLASPLENLGRQVTLQLIGGAEIGEVERKKSA